MPQKTLPARPGDADLDRPPAGVQIALSLLAGRHWSECIVGDPRPEEAETAHEARCRSLGFRS